jgi:hypothetical protein
MTFSCDYLRINVMRFTRLMKRLSLYILVIFTLVFTSNYTLATGGLGDSCTAKPDCVAADQDCIGGVCATRAPTTGTNTGSPTASSNAGNTPAGFVKGIENYIVSAPDLGKMVSDVFDWSLSILGIVVFISFFMSGVQWATAYGNPSKVSQAQDRMKQTVFGAILLVSSYVILNVINPDFVGQKTQLPPLDPISSGSTSNNNSALKAKGEVCVVNSDCASNSCTGATADSDGRCN